MENQFFRCTQRAISQRRVITLGPIFYKNGLKSSARLEEKSQEVSARKNNNRQRYNKKCRRGGRIPPPALLGLIINRFNMHLNFVWNLWILKELLKSLIILSMLNEKNLTSNNV